MTTRFTEADIRFEHLPVNPTGNPPRLEYTATFDELRRRNGRDTPHGSIDIRATKGSPVYAVARGRVARMTSAVTAGNRCGNGIVLVHDLPNQPRYETTYCHLDSDPRSDGFAPGQGVLGGQVLGKAGNSVGRNVNPIAPHLHFTLTLAGGRKVDPIPLFRSLENGDARYVGRGSINRSSVVSTTPSSGGTQGGTPFGISPFIASLKSFHPKIQYELMRRSLSSDTVSAHMPFVRLTSLTIVDSEDLQDSNTVAWCPSLGVHGMKDVAFEDFYSTKSNPSIVAYAYTTDGVRTPVVVKEQSTDDTTVGEAPLIASPGIVSMKTERNLAGPMGVRGGLFRSKIMIRAYSVPQLDTLMKYFLRPATRVVLEYGRMSTNRRDLDIRPYEWEQKTADEIYSDFQKLVVLGGTNGDEQRKFIEKYTYNNYGNYEAFIGYVSTFKVKYAGIENRYDIELDVHSVQQFEVPNQFSGARSQCSIVAPEADKGKTVSIGDYFRPKSGKVTYNMDGLITYVLGLTEESDPLYQYKNHVIAIGDNSGETSETLGEKAYFISWEFFINAVLNDSRYGMMNVFQLSGADERTLEFIRMAIPQPIGSTNLEDPTINDNQKIRQNFAGYHPSLRSTDPRVMVISNPVAQEARQRDFDVVVRLIADDLRTSVDTKSTVDRVIGSGGVIGHFQPTDGNVKEPGIAPMSRGVWLNTNIIKNAFQSTDTLSAALGLLLTKMNAASMGYWNLQLLSNDTTAPGVHVIDMTLSGTANTAVPPRIINSTGEFLNLIDLQDTDEHDAKYLYVFNRKNLRGITDDVGSELTDVSIDFGLPLVVAVQALAGLGGVASRGVMNLIDYEDLARISMFRNQYPTCPSDQQGGGPGQTTSGGIQGRVDPYPSKGQLVFERLGEITTGVATEARDERLANNANVTSFVREYALEFGRVIRLIEYDTERLLNDLNKDAFLLPTRPHPFNSSNLTKTLVNLTLPGIGGIELWRTFNVDKIPTILTNGVYTVVKVEHEFTVEKGWFTKIQGRFRYVPVK